MWLVKEVNGLNNLQKVRKEKGLSQLKLALMTGIAPSEISRIENDWLKPYPGWRKRLARALGITEAKLFPDEKRV
jgi:transcriptional regulator with XRE-family HTH domain